MLVSAANGEVGDEEEGWEWKPVEGERAKTRSAAEKRRKTREVMSSVTMGDEEKRRRIAEAVSRADNRKEKNQKSRRVSGWERARKRFS